MKNCSDILEIVSAYIDNELTADKRMEFEEHIASCAACREELDETLKIVNICSNIEEEELPENFKEEIHSKLLLINEQQSNKKKIAMFHNKYFKIFSSVAAALLLIFLVKGFYDFGLFAPGKLSNDSNMISMKAAGLDQAGGQENAAMIKGKSAEDTASQYNANKSSKALDGASVEMGRSGTNDVRESPIMKFSAAADTALNRTSNMVVLVDDIDTQLKKIKTIAEENGGKQQESNSAGQDEEMSIQTTGGSSDTKINFLIPNNQYDTFTYVLNSNFGQSNVQFSAPVTEDLTNTIDSLIAELNALDADIKKEEGKGSFSDQDKINTMYAQKEKLETEIENIRLGADFTTVTIVLRKK